MAKLLGYSFRVEWVPGKNHFIADTLSRNPVFAAPDDKDIIIQRVAEVIEDEALAEMSDIAEADKDYQEVVTAVDCTMARKSKISTDHILHYSIEANGTTWLSTAYC